LTSNHGLTQSRLSRGLPPYQVHLNPCSRLATIRQRHRQTDRQTGQWSDSIGRIVLQTVAQKPRLQPQTTGSYSLLGNRCCCVRT